MNQNKSPKFDAILSQVVGILMASVVIALTVNSFSNDRLPLIYQTIRIEPGSYLNTEQALRIYRAGAAIFIDARSEEEFRAGHIRNAINLPQTWPRNKKMAVFTKLPLNENIIVYCANSDCSGAERLAGEIAFYGFKYVSVYVDGFHGWQFAGFPDEKN